MPHTYVVFGAAFLLTFAIAASLLLQSMRRRQSREFLLAASALVGAGSVALLSEAMTSWEQYHANCRNAYLLIHDVGLTQIFDRYQGLSKWISKGDEDRSEIAKRLTGFDLKPLPTYELLIQNEPMSTCVDWGVFIYLAQVESSEDALLSTVTSPQKSPEEKYAALEKYQSRLAEAWDVLCKTADGLVGMPQESVETDCKIAQWQP